MRLFSFHYASPKKVKGDRSKVSTAQKGLFPVGTSSTKDLRKQKISSEAVRDYRCFQS